MYGFARVQLAVERHQRFEDQREKWVETREEDGRPVEYLMVRCEESGRPWSRQRVLRFNKDEIREWQTIRRECNPNWARYNFMLAPLALLAIGAATWSASSSIVASIVVVLAMWAIWAVVTVRLCNQRIAELNEKKRRILSRHGNIPEDDVGMADQYYKNYVILPAISR